MPSISAVIVNYNGGKCIIKSIHTLYQQEIQLKEIIVIDNGSTDGSIDLIKTNFPNVQLIELGKNTGASKARNIGLKKCTTELVLILDDDVYLSKDCLSQMLITFNQEMSTVICPRVLLFPECNIIQTDGAATHFVGTMILRHGYFHVKDTPIEATTVGGCTSACLLVNRKHVLEAGGFDEVYFIYLEDLEFSLRLRSLGYKIICEPAAVVYHERGSGTPGLSFRGNGKYPSRRAFLMTRNRLMTILIHYRIRTILVLLPALLLYELASLTFVLLRGWFNEWIKAWLWILNNMLRIQKRRKRVQRARSLDDKDLLVGGLPPLAPGLIRSNLEKVALLTLSKILNKYWGVAKNWIG